MSDTCIFCKIAAGSVPAHVVYEDDLVLAFLDIHPMREGHTQLIPRAHHTYFDELPEALASHMMTAGQHLARVLKAELGPPRVAFMFAGGDVAHAHAHLVPLHELGDALPLMSIIEGKPVFHRTPPQDELAAMAARLRRRN